QRLTGSALMLFHQAGVPTLPDLLVSVYDSTGDTLPLRLRAIQLMEMYDTAAIRERLEAASGSAEPNIERAARERVRRRDGEPVPLVPLDPFDIDACARAPSRSSRSAPSPIAASKPWSTST